ncbi:MAG: hypothetical protein CMC35_00535 [Flavobacteriaceae bacterium]|nr:hypothetical protein [Flavobacteriaceae bacterium]
MKTLTTFIICMIAIGTALSQKVPVIQVGETNLGVAKLTVHSEVIGNRMTTTYDMYFYNPTSEVLEGELIFPLGENQAVNRFALDVFGTLREAVVVKKEQGRVAFEAVVRRGVDPALLEKGTGNNYKARIYPIPAKGYKRVVLGYEEVLPYSEGYHVSLPLDFDRSLESFSFQLKHYKTDAPRILSGNAYVSRWKKTSNGYQADYRASNITLKESLELVFEGLTPLQTFQTGDYFYAHQTLETPLIPRKTNDQITLLWDASLSMRTRDLKKELAILEAYIAKKQSLKVSVIIFSNEVRKQHDLTISDGNAEPLISVLKAVPYDGGTSFGFLDKMELKGDTFLFSDGLETLSAFPKQMLAPLFVINSKREANHTAMRSLAASFGGTYINLDNHTVARGLEQLETVPLSILAVHSEETSLEVYPAVGHTVTQSLSISGKNVRKKPVHVIIGHQDQVIDTLSITFEEAKIIAEVPRIWAQMKLMELQKNSAENKDEIITLATNFNLVSDHTSLIVLETVHDYIKYNITPPQELMAEYRRIMKGRERVRVTNAEEVSTERSKESSVATTMESLPNGTSVRVSGTILDTGGLPLPGVNVIVKGTSTGTQTDFEGEFSLETEAGADLVFSYLGFTTLETTVTGNGNININMMPDAASLDEVIVVAQGIQKEARAVGYAVSAVSAEEIENRTEGDISRVLSGKASGVQITQQSGTSGSATNVIIRGYNSITGSNQPLFIVDGVPMASNTNAQGSFLEGNVGSSRILDLDPNMIADVNVLKGLAATTLYGSEGRNGVVIITTKSTADLPTPTLGTIPKAKNDAEKLAELLDATPYTFSVLSLPYIQQLHQKQTLTEKYEQYLEDREQMFDKPYYFMDVYDYFMEYDEELARRILSNIPELEMDNYEFLKAYAYKLEAENSYELAAFIYRRVIELRSEDAQSYRDLALVLQQLDREEEALALLKKINLPEFYENSHRRNFLGMQQVSSKELGSLVHSIPYQASLKGLPVATRSKNEMDVRVVIDWNHNDTDIDLHIVDPNFEKCLYSDPKTRSGGQLSEDVTEGFGPEEFSQINALNGTYYIMVDYFDDRYQKMATPTYLKLTIYRNYGKASESKEIKVLRLQEEEETFLVGSITL